jgi:hypothetical protein
MKWMSAGPGKKKDYTPSPVCMQKIQKYIESSNWDCADCKQYLCAEHPTFQVHLSEPDFTEYYEGCYADWMDWYRRLPQYSPRQFYLSDMAVRMKRHIEHLTADTVVIAATPLDILFNWKIDINRLWNNEAVLTSVLKYVRHLESLEDNTEITKTVFMRSLY